LRLKVLVHQKTPPALHEERLLGVVGSRSGRGELMPCVALLGVRIVVDSGGEGLRQQLRVDGNTGVLTVGVRSASPVVENSAGNRSEMRTEVSEHGVEGLVLVKNEKDMLDFSRRRLA